MYRCELHDIPRFLKAKLTDNSDGERVKVVIEQAPLLSSYGAALTGGLGPPCRPLSRRTTWESAILSADACQPDTKTIYAVYQRFLGGFPARYLTRPRAIYFLAFFFSSPFATLHRS